MKESSRFIVLAFLARLAVIPLSYFGINPYATHDAVRFARFAQDLSITNLVTIIPGRIDHVNLIWGSLLSPLFALPGPGRIYAAITMAALGALATGNVYVIARRLHSHDAGIYAASATALLPSFLFIQSTLVREAYVLFCLTTALNAATATEYGRIRRTILVTGLLAAASLVRIENIALFVLLGVVGALVEVGRRTDRYEQVITTAVAGAVLVFPFLIAAFNRVYQSALRPRRIRRTYGNTAYLDGVFPASVWNTIAFSWIAGLYFYFAPFPWMITGPGLAVLAVESLVAVAFAGMAVTGARHVRSEYRWVVAVVVVGLVLAGVLYGLGNGNIGAVTRLRQQFIWGLYLLGGIGFAQTGLPMSSPQESLSNAWRNSRLVSFFWNETTRAAVDNSALVRGLRTVNRVWRQSTVSSILGISGK